MSIARLAEDDIDSAALVHAAVFDRQRFSKEWIDCNFRAFPRTQIFVAREAGRVVGFVQWTQKSGFRSDVVLELEQIAVLPNSRGDGIGTRMIVESLSSIRALLKKDNATIKHVIVTTRSDNAAQRLYRTTLGARVEATIPDLFSADEVLMVARNLEEP